MQFEERLVEATLIRRYKRFLADVRFDDGSVLVAHVPNTGSMKSTCDPGSRVALSRSRNPGRKLAWTLELVRAESGSWVGVNTARPNRIAEEAIAGGRIAALKGYGQIRREVPYGGNSRIDLLLEEGDRRCYVEVKNVTYRVGNRALFPDAVTERGQKHLGELRKMVRKGHRAAAFFLVNRGDCDAMGLAADIDPDYARLLGEVADAGVELLAYRARASLDAIAIDRKLKIFL